MKRSVLASILFAAAVTGAAGIAVAAQAHNAANDALTDLAKAKISLVDAVSAAEKHVGGRATKAELESERGSTTFHVEVASADKVTDVVIDSTDGRVVSSKPDSIDRGEDDHDDD